MSISKNKGGRPTKEPEGRAERIYLRVTTQQKQEIEELAKQAGKSVSDLVIDTLVKKLIE